jgi:probable phosphoglycerate mutase
MPRGPAEVWLIRHGSTPWSRTGRHTGRSEIDLDAQGVRQAARLTLLLAGVAAERVFVSPRRRALETARLAGLGGRAEVVAELAEWDYGEYEGFTTEEIRAHVPGWEVWTGPVPGGEALPDVAARAERVIERVDAAGGRVICVAHAHVLAVLAARLLGLPAEAGAALPLEAGALGVIGHRRERRVLCTWNRRPPPVP